MAHLLTQELRVSSPEIAPPEAGGHVTIGLEMANGHGSLAKPPPGRVTKPLSRLPNKKPVDLRFENLGYDVSLGCRKGHKKILHEVNGHFPPSQLIAIMGPSGAGKSSLLDILSGYRITGVTGNVLTNNKERELNSFRRKSCYITQDDRLQPLLTVRENMKVAADLKLGSEVKPKERTVIIEEILSTLGLIETQSTRASMLSGGQRKRLSIALELINNPLVMFLDEPTTGLDSSSCTQCLTVLKLLARQGRTIVCTIHQPSASLFQMFDQVYVLAAGQCLYQGSPQQLIPYLQDVELPCPMYHNPADYVIELACGEYGEDKVERMVKGVDNGRVSTWMTPDLVDVSLAKTDTTKVVGKKKKSQSSRTGNMQETSQWNQLKVLFYRGYIKTKRDTTLTYMRLGVNALVGLMLGAMYINSGNDGARIFDNYNLLFSCLMHHVMTTMMLTILTFPSEMEILKKEHFNRWYSLKAYFTSITIIDIPITVISCTIFTCIVYFMSNQPHEVDRFFMFFSISLLVVFVAQGIGLMIGAVFNVVNGTFLGPTMAVPMMMFAGFGVTLNDLPPYLKWGSYVSYLRYGLEGYVDAIYGGDRPTLDCSMLYCHYKFPYKFRQQIGLEGDQFWMDVTSLVSILIIFRVLAYVLLRWKLMAVR